MRELRLRAEFHCWPIWEPGTGDGLVDPESLPLSTALKHALSAWAAAWDRTLNQAYPPDSKFPSPAEEGAFEREGRRLRAALQSELGCSFRAYYRSHRPPPLEWPFEDPRNVAVFTTADVIDRSLPIVYVTHDEDDGAWQFHSVNGAPEDTKEHRLVALEEIVQQDPTIAELADLPCGWCAKRYTVGDAWRREKYTEPVYVRTPGKGMNAWVAALGRMLGPMRFEILPTPGHDSAAEGWEFQPGTIVVCQLWRRSLIDDRGWSPMDERTRAELDVGGPAHVALRRWDPELPLPTPSPRLRLFEPKELCDLRITVEQRDPGCLVCLGEILPDADERLTPERALVDLSVLALGQSLAARARANPPSKTWRRIDRARAERHLRYALGHDLAYESVVLNEEAASQITRSFLALFGEDAEYFTSHDVGENGSPGSGTPILNATFEGGIGVVDGRRAGLLIVTGED